MIKLAIRQISSKKYLKKPYDTVKLTPDPLEAKMWDLRNKNIVKQVINEITFREYLNSTKTISGHVYPKSGTTLNPIFEIVEVKLTCQIVNTLSQSITVDTRKSGSLEYVVFTNRIK